MALSFWNDSCNNHSSSAAYLEDHMGAAKDQQVRANWFLLIKVIACLSHQTETGSTIDIWLPYHYQKTLMLMFCKSNKDLKNVIREWWKKLLCCAHVWIQIKWLHGYAFVHIHVQPLHTTQQPSSLKVMDLQWSNGHFLRQGTRVLRSKSLQSSHAVQCVIFTSICVQRNKREGTKDMWGDKQTCVIRWLSEFYDTYAEMYS